MIYFYVPLGKGQRSCGKRCPIQLSFVAYIACAIVYVKNNIWITHYERRTSKRDFGVLRQ